MKKGIERISDLLTLVYNNTPIDSIAESMTWAWPFIDNLFNLRFICDEQQAIIGVRFLTHGILGWVTIDTEDKKISTDEEEACLDAEVCEAITEFLVSTFGW